MDFDKENFLKIELAKIYVDDTVPQKTICKINNALRKVGFNVPKSAAGHLRPIRKANLVDDNLLHYDLKECIVKKIKF